jgi:hypothetical protein
MRYSPALTYMKKTPVTTIHLPMQHFSETSKIPELASRRYSIREAYVDAIISSLELCMLDAQ